MKPAYVVRVRKRPVIVEAARFASSDRGQELADWCGGTWIPAVGEIVIPTLEGRMIARLGDWILCGTVGEFYPVTPGIFAESYEDAEPVRPAARERAE